MDLFEPGRSERIRTSGPYVPNVVLYQAELHSAKGGQYTPIIRSIQFPGQHVAVLLTLVELSTERKPVMPT